MKSFFQRYYQRFHELDGTRQIIVVAFAGMVLFILWAGLTNVEEVARGQGRVIPSSQIQVIQAAEPSTIEAILVRSGQSVKRGQLLVRLDDSQSSSALGQIQAENERLEARAQRLQRESSGGTTDCPPGEACTAEAELQAVRLSALRERVSGLSSQVEQRRRDLSEAQATAQSLESSLRLAREQVNMLAPLAEKNIVPRTELLSAQREAVDLQGRLAATRQSASRSQAAVAEALSQVSTARLEFQQEALNERTQVETRLAVNEESLRGAKGRLSRTEIKSPVDGVVNEVEVSTVGAFVNMGDKIMQVVPVGDKLLVETRIRPNDIAFIRVGDRANVKVTAYDFSIYGGLPGRVVRVSADSIYDDVERQAFFTVVVETDLAYLQQGSHRLPITPGMVCDVEVITGNKSILTYLVKPFLKLWSEALTER